MRRAVLSMTFVLAIMLLPSFALSRADATADDLVDPDPPLRWLKGNLHTHSLWSDGDDYPEMIVDWYKQHGYHFLALSDHNILAQGNKWIDATTNKGGAVALDKYLQRFGTKWVQLRESKGRQQVRLKTLTQYRKLFEA